MKILDRYILKEIIVPFLNGILAFTAILIAGLILPKMVELMTGPHPLSLSQAGMIFIYQLPSILVLTFPMSSLLGSLQGIGRLSGDSEIIVMKAGGISFSRMMRWILVGGVLVSIGTFWFNDTLVPAGNSRAQDIIRSVSDNGQSTNALVLQDWEGNKLSRVVIAQAFQGRTNTLLGVTMLQYRGNQAAGIVVAKKAQWKEKEGRWEFQNGYLQQISPEGPYGSTRFDRLDLSLSKRPEDVKLSQRKAEEMSYEELRKTIHAIARQGGDVKDYLVNLQLKLSLPLASLVFVLIGAPLGLRPHRGGSALGFGLAIMIVFFYYVLAHFLAAAGSAGSLSPALAAWTPDVIGAAIGIGLIYKTAR